MSPIYSHPPVDERDGVLLREHLRDVADRVQYVVPADAGTPAGEQLREVVETLAWVHDFGKATTYFQEYLPPNRSSPDDPRLRHHAPIGSFVAYYALDARGFETETCIAGFVAVAKHHGRLPDLVTYIRDRTLQQSNASPGEQTSEERRGTGIIETQIRNIDENAVDLAEDVLRIATSGAGDWASFRDGFTDLLGEIEDTVMTPGRMPVVRDDPLSRDCYGLALQCWSALVLVDKTSAAGAPNNEATFEPEAPSFDRLDDHVRDIEARVTADPEGTRAERLNHYRSRARNAVLERATTLAEDGAGVATLTLPTGMGKTLTGLSAALDLRDRLEGDRVVYALPFTSVIDQVVDEVTEIYQTDTSGRLLTAHHHLAETVIRDSRNDIDDEEADRNDAIGGMLAESWRAGLTVTTFVQFFESLAGPENRQCLKLPALQDSVVILDEPQSLPLDWWKLVPRLVDVLTEQYGATVIAMTATQPRLFDDAFELVDDPDEYFGAVERVTYELDESVRRYVSEREGPLGIEDAAATLLETVRDDESTLAICNTIDSASTLHDHVSEQGTFVHVTNVYERILHSTGTVDGVEPAALAGQVVDAGDRALLHLSTRLRPADRLTLVETAKELTDRGHPLVVVSTQLVEAGVDISFDHVFRDLAPIDSIVQAAGRCNRSFERDCGHVRVWWLEPPEDLDTTPAEAVYNRKTPLLPVVAEVLETVRDDAGTLAEQTVAREAVEKYYERLHNEKDVGKGEYVEYVGDSRAEKLADLSLIEQRRAADVLVCRTDADRTLAENLRTALDERDFERVQELRQEAKQLTVSVPYYREDSSEAEALRTLPSLDADLGLLELDVRDHSRYFDVHTGVDVPESTAEARIL